MKSIKENVRNMKGEEDSSNESLQDSNDERISDAQQPIESELQSSEADRGSLPSSQQRSSDLVLSPLVYDPEVGYETGHYKIEKIKARRWNLQQRRFQYLIKWKGYSDKQCTWQTTEDIIGEPRLQLKDLGKKTLLPVFERTHAKTFIFDEQKNKTIKEYMQTRKNHLKYASKEFIQRMDKEMQQLYGKKKNQSQEKEKVEIKKQTKPEQIIKLQHDRIIEEPKKSINQKVEESETLKEFKVKHITIEKLLYFPLQFQLKVLVRLNSDPETKRMLTCSQMMKIDHQTAIICYKTKLAMIEKWKKQNLIKTDVKS